eukprot:TRINITY_DN5808_c0_g1_i9.p2 TRINITY_DN5808_c0_g1~~TRINITY_DN5808_c0_g1_i9.p2  ORF type:complete len:180 (-),score=1.93 TRINITY_DN5808_c0_g1_i9:917-1456(-)
MQLVSIARFLKPQTASSMISAKYESSEGSQLFNESKTSETSRFTEQSVQYGNKLIQEIEKEDKSVVSRTGKFKVLSFNILAASYVSTAYFPYCPVEYLDFGFRSSRVVETIRNLGSDIICLQEVDHYADCYLSKFTASLDYTCEYLPRKTKPDGVLIGWKSKRQGNLISPQFQNADLSV